MPVRDRAGALRRWVSIALAVVLTSGGVLLAARYLVEAQAREASRPAGVLDARSVASGPGVPAVVGGRVVPGATRLVPMEPTLALDTRGLSALAAGAEVTVRLRDLPPDTVAVLVEVSVVAAAGPGDVTVDGGAGPVTVLRLPRAGAQQSATAVVRVGEDGTLRIRTGGGDLLVNLVGAFQTAAVASAGRIVALPPVPVVRLVTKRDGKDARIRLSAVAGLRRAGPISAVLLNVAADVGPRGGSVAAGSAPGGLDQTVFWAASAGADRTRGGFLIVPVAGDVVDLHYQAGTEMRVDLVGYVTGDDAVASATGLILPVPPEPVRLDPSRPEPVPADPGRPVRVPAGASRDAVVVPPAGLAGVPPGRVSAALLGVLATGDAVGGVTVHPPGSAAPRNPTLLAPAGSARSALALAGVADGRVRIRSAAGASVTVIPRALILT